MAKGHWLLSVVVYGAVTFWLLTIYVTFYAGGDCDGTARSPSLQPSYSVHLGWTRPGFPGE